MPWPLVAPLENDNTTPKDSETGATTLDSNAAPSSPAAIERQSSGDSSCEMEEQDGQDQQAKVKQEPYEEEGLNHHHHQHDDHDEEEEEEERSLAKRPKMELVDAEANTVHTGELRRIESFLTPLHPAITSAHYTADDDFPHPGQITWRIFGWQN